VIERNGKRGSTYALRFRAYGRRRYITLGGPEEGWTRELAETELQNVLADVRRGLWRDPDVEAQASGEPKPVPLFADFARDWLAGCKDDGLGARTVEDYTWAVELHLIPILGSLRVDEIGVREVDTYRQAKAREGVLGPNSVNKTITRLSQILALAVDHELIAANPATGKRRRLKRTATRQTWCEPYQLMALLEGADGLLLGRGRPLLATLSGAGLRVGEVLALTWENVSTDRGELIVLASKTDAGRRTVDLTPALRDELAAWHRRTRYPAPSDFVFPNGKGRQDNRNNVRRRLLDPAVAKANVKLTAAGIEPIKNLTTHGLRRTYGSLRHAAGDEAVYTATQIGHADASFTLRVYTVAAKRRERMSEAERAEAERAYAWASWTAGLGTSAQTPGLRIVDGGKAGNAEAA
jgi:integrase